MDNLIKLEEYREQVVREVTENDLSYLNNSFLKKQPFAFKISWTQEGYPKIENSSFAGIIQLENKRIHFSTKVKANLFYMLSFLKSEDVFTFDPLKVIEIKEGANFFDIIGRLFFNELNSIIKRGILKKYVRREENCQYLKGKLLFNQQISKNLLFKPKFYNAYYDLTCNNLENQIILRATNLLIPMIRFNEKLRYDLLRLERDLKEKVTLNACLSQRDCDFISYSRLNQHYKPIIEFSKLIFEEFFIRSVNKGKSKGFNFIVNMWQVYEDFVTEIIKEVIIEDTRFSENFVVVSQLPFDTLVKEKDIVTKPDIVIRDKNSGKYPLIIDAKYKKKESNIDFYQLIAYALAIPSSKNCCLIYPESEMEKQGEYTVVRNLLNKESDTIKLYTRTISLFEEKDENFDSFIKRLKEEQIKPLLILLFESYAAVQ